MDPSKFETMSNWPIPTQKRDILAFLDFANSYCRLIVNYSAKVRLLINLTRNVLLTCCHTQQRAFDELQARFLSSPILIHFHRTLMTIMETDARNQAIAGILSEYHVVNECKQLHLVEYYPKTLSATQCNYPIHGKQLCAIVDCSHQ